MALPVVVAHMVREAAGAAAPAGPAFAGGLAYTARHRSDRHVTSREERSGAMWGPGGGTGSLQGHSDLVDDRGKLMVTVLYVILTFVITSSIGPLVWY